MSKSVSSFARNFRDRFYFGTNDITHYFPGHMTKGLRQIQSKLRDIDCIIEVHDARIPISGRNPVFKDQVIVKPHLLLYNKMDLADLKYMDRIKSYYKQEGISNILCTNCKQDIHYTIKRKLLPAVTTIIESSPRYNRENSKDYRLLVIGVPNVGKSSLINALRRQHMKKGKATKVGAEAGVTRSVLYDIKVCENPPITVLDSPGILQPRVNDIEVGMKLALCSTLKDHLVGEQMIVDYMLYWLNSHQKFKYVQHYNLDGPIDDMLEFLYQVAKANNMFHTRRAVQKGVLQFTPNFDAAAAVVLKDFRNGFLGKVNLDMDITDKIEGA